MVEFLLKRIGQCYHFMRLCNHQPIPIRLPTFLLIDIVLVVLVNVKGDELAGIGRRLVFKAVGVSTGVLGVHSVFIALFPRLEWVSNDREAEYWR